MKETAYRIAAPIDIMIALVSDFHNSDPGEITNSLCRRRPDMIAIAGDLLVGYRPKDDCLMIEQQRNALPCLRECVRIAPTYVSLGNHEWMVCDADLERISETGACLLDNTWVSKDGFVIGGLTSASISDYQKYRHEHNGERYPYRGNRPRSLMLKTDSGWLSDFEKQPGYKILLSHHPEYWQIREPYLVNRKIDLVLSGHAHGGQIRIFNHGLYAPGQGLFPKYTRGVYQGKHGCMVVSSGLANTAAPVLRMFNPQEVVYLELGSPA